jgi:predicted alpha/beta superfamily hydrolase
MVPVPAPDLLGTLERHADFASRHVVPRPVDVWLPPGYAEGGERRYPVLYMHDGQNLFDPELAFGGVDWGLDEALGRLAAAGDIPETMVVAIWNTGEARWTEYMPQKPLASPSARRARQRFIREAVGRPGRMPTCASW